MNKLIPLQQVLYLLEWDINACLCKEDITYILWILQLK